MIIKSRIVKWRGQYSEKIWLQNGLVIFNHPGFDTKEEAINFRDRMRARIEREEREEKERLEIRAAAKAAKLAARRSQKERSA